VTDFGNIESPPPNCPPPPASDGPPGPSQTPRDVAVSFLREVPLPQPKPHIAPGRAITGKPAYLETHGSTTATFEEETSFGHLTVVATGAYYVDWGDGKATGPYPFEGEAWPTGKITHSYIDEGSVDIVVTEAWHGDWTLGGDSGTLDDLHTAGRIDGFPVQQIQAVIGR